MNLLLVHSPLVGPSTWARFAAVARSRGSTAVVPDLTEVATAPEPQWRHLVSTAVEAAAGIEDLVVVGHSGAGAVLPLISDALGQRGRCLVFVDAVVPPAAGRQEPSDAFLDFVDTQTANGQLSPWIEWWPPDVVDHLLPSVADQETLRADMPTLPRSFYDHPIPTPDRWKDQACAYLQLSPAYDAEVEVITTWGWPVGAIDGTHLSIFTDPEAVFDEVERLVSALD